MNNKEKMYEQKQESIRILSKYANIINLIFADYNRKSTDETMMVKSFRKSDLETTNRKTHSENLEGIAGIIAEYLDLNVPIVKIMARNHDIGHTFLGHSGEWWLSEIKKKNGLGCYVHNSLGVRDLEYTYNIEKQVRDAIKTVYLGNEKKADEEIDKVCDDLWIILDAINSHNGELSESSYEPNFSKTKNDYEEELLKCHTIKGYDKTIMPATTEGCLMRLCDKISYIPYDMVDGLREGMIDDLNEDYREILVPILTSDNKCTEKEAKEYIQNCVLKRNYSNLARKLQMIFVKDVIQNSSKERIAMSDKMSELMHRLRKVNNEQVVDYVLMSEDHEVYPKALQELVDECKNILIQEDIVHKLNGADKDNELSERLLPRYKGTPYYAFMEYVLDTSNENFEWTEKMLKLAKNETMKSKKEKSNSYLSIEESIAIEFSTKYLATLSDTEFMQLLRDTGKISDEQYESLTRKYKDIDLKSEYMTHSNWDKISKEQNESIDYGEK